MAEQEAVQQEMFDQSAEPLGPAEPVQQETYQEPQQQAPEPEASVPSWRLREEAEGRRVAEDRARAMEDRLRAIDQHFRQQKAQQQPTNFFENPDAATQEVIIRTLAPYAQETRRQLMYMGRMIATARHGDDKVAEAESAFLDARRNRTLDPSDFERVVQAPNRYDAVVHWHKRHSAINTVGDDPDAWFEQRLETRMADPEFQAKLMERVRTGAQRRPSATRLPPSLSRATASANSGGDPIGDLSDESLFAYAMRK